MNTLKKFKNFVDEINLENSRNYKLSILEKYKDDEDVKFYLNFVFNPYIVTGISDKKLEFTEGIISTFCMPRFSFEFSVKGCLNYVSKNNTGSYEILHDIALFKYAMALNMPGNEELRCLFNKILIKNLQLGIDAKSINKIIPNLIPQFSVQLAEKFFEQKENFLDGKEFAITTKIDGMRCIMLKENGNVTFWSRQGQQIEGLVDLEEEAKYLPDGIALDGELVAIVDGPDTYKDTMKKARTKDAEKHGLKMKVFDYMTAEGFRNQNYKDHYLGRRADLIVMFSRSFREEAIKRGKEFAETHPNHVGYVWRNDQIELINTKYTYFEILPILYEGSDTSKIIELLEEQTSKGEEGVMINIVDALYEFKRTSQLLKVKKMQTLDLEVVGFEEGTNSNQGTLGALLVRYKDGNIVKVGSGFEKELRDEIWNNQKDWLGRIVEVQYFEETENANGGKSIRFPVYKDYRTDKAEADY